MKDDYTYISITFINGETEEIEVDGDWDIKITVDYQKRVIIHIFGDGSESIYPFENIREFNPSSDNEEVNQ